MGSDLPKISSRAAKYNDLKMSVTSFSELRPFEGSMDHNVSLEVFLHVKMCRRPTAVILRATDFLRPLFGTNMGTFC